MAEQSVNDEQAEIKKRAVQRMIVAASLVAAAIIALTVLNHKPAEQPQPAVPTPAPVAEKPQPLLTEAPPEKPLEEKPAETPAVETVAHPDSEAAPPPPPPPQILNKAGQTPTATIKPHVEAPSTAAMIKAPPAEQAAPPKPVAQTAPKSAPSEPPPAAATGAKPVPAATLLKPVETKPAPAAAKPAEPAPPAPRTPAETVAAPKGYTVQLGLFSNPENALQLQKRLAENGIKSYTETRLNVGPFQNKTEADQALAKIRNMGINAVLVPTR